MKHLSVRFLVGLKDENGLALTDEEKEKAIEYLANQYQAGGVYEGTGYWRGGEEPCFMFESIVTDCEHERIVARMHAKYIADILEQEAIGLVFTPCEFELI